MITVNRQTATAFVNAKGTVMTVRMTRGKTAISLRAALLVEGQEKAVTGGRVTFDLDEAGAIAAKAAYKAMLAMAETKGWSKQRKPGKVRVDAFGELPEAEGAESVIPAEVAPLTDSGGAEVVVAAAPKLTKAERKAAREAAKTAAA